MFPNHCLKNSLVLFSSEKGYRAPTIYKVPEEPERRMTQSVCCRKSTSIELVIKHNRDSERRFQNQMQVPKKGCRCKGWWSIEMGISGGQEQMVTRPEGWRAFHHGRNGTRWEDVSGKVAHSV